MPEKEGLETIRELRGTHPSVRIIAMSGAFEGRFLKSAALLGARATIRKPVAPDELIRTIERVLGSSN
jgi:DNA-binding NarL/FixJ family response regulator